MTHDQLQAMTAERLVERFVRVAIDQDRAMRKEENSKYNRLYRQMTAIVEELKQRAEDQRKLLVPFLKHPNAQVRLMAAIETLALSPDLARKTLRNISDWDEYPQAPYARGMLRGLDDGSYTPT